MIWQVLLALAIGILVGFSGLVPGPVSGNMDTVLMALLCVLLFIIGIDLSQNRNVVCRDQAHRRPAALHTAAASRPAASSARSRSACSSA